MRLASIILLLSLVTVGWAKGRLTPPSADPTSVSAAAVNYYLHIPGVEGESIKAGHEGDIELLGYGLKLGDGASELPAVQTNQKLAEAAKLHQLSLNKYVSKASPKLLELCAAGTTLDGVQVKVERSGTDGSLFEFLVLVLDGVTCTNLTESGDPAGVPVDELSLDFDKITYKYTTQQGDGNAGETVEGVWEIESKQ
jgi:type VI secretion system secreted protein Hcp